MKAKKILRDCQRILRDCRGNIIPDTTANFLIFAVVVGLALSTFGAIAKKFTIVQATDNVKRMIETSGKYDTSEQTEISNYLSSRHIEVTHVTVSPAKDRYALNERFNVTLSTTSTLGSGSFGSITVPLESTANGSCEVYNK